MTACPRVRYLGDSLFVDISDYRAVTFDCLSACDIYLLVFDTSLAHRCI